MWTSQPGTPRAYSEAELAPLQLQLIPPPSGAGSLDAITVDSLAMDLTNSNVTFQVPDEWVFAIKYAALSQILGSEGQIKDTMRADYCESRYQQAIAFAKQARTIHRGLLNELPVNLDAETNIDSSLLYWRNQTGKPSVIGVMYDMLMVAPGNPQTTYTLTADVSQSAPIPVHLSDTMPVGYELYDALKNYVCHILSFKCGGKEFQSSMSGYDEFMKTLSRQKGINAALIQYLEPLFGQAQGESALRPDYMEQQ